MKEHTSNERVLKVVGIDLAKRSFQVYGVDERGQRAISKTFTRTRLREFMASLPAARSRWRRVAAPTIGPGRFAPTGMRCG
jgi:transposase